MARCPDCNKFVGVDSSEEPQVDLNVDEQGNVDVTAEIANNCDQCGTTMFTGSLDGTVDASEIVEPDGMTLTAWLDTLTPAQKDSMELEVNESGTDRTDRYEGKGRGARHFYGCQVDFEVVLTYDNGNAEESKTFSGKWNDDMQASSMDQQ